MYIQRNNKQTNTEKNFTQQQSLLKTLDLNLDGSKPFLEAQPF